MNGFSILTSVLLIEILIERIKNADDVENEMVSKEQSNSRSVSIKKKNY